MTDELPAPPIPDYVDLRTFDDMPFNVVKFLNSDILVAATDAEFRAAVRLWAKAWHQIPAGSLPENDVYLADMAGYGRDQKGWKKVRAGALRAFELCNDGRLYHPTICEAAMSAWGKKRAGKEGAEARWNKPKPLKSNKSRNATASGLPNGTPQQSAMCLDDATADASAMPRTELNRTDKKNIPPPLTGAGSDFEEFYKSFPRKVGRGQAERAFATAIKKNHGAPAEILEGAKRYAAERSGEDPKFTKHPATWLNGKCWLDVAAEPALIANGNGDGRHPDWERNGWLSRVASFRKKGFWLEHLWGPPPGTRGCQCPPDVIAEVDKSIEPRE